MLCTDYQADLTRVAVAMFARWCQENFSKYMRQHYSIDRLIEYGTEALPDTIRVVNPLGATLTVRFAANGLLQREMASFGNIHLPAELDPTAVEACQREKGALQQRIEARRSQIAELKAQRKSLSKHILLPGATSDFGDRLWLQTVLLKHSRDLAHLERRIFSMPKDCRRSGRLPRGSWSHGQSLVKLHRRSRWFP
jgi:hypothetical protein